MQEIIKPYTDYLEQLGYASLSIYDKHKRHLREFISFTSKSGVQGWHQIEVHHIDHYLDYLKGRENKVIGGKLTAKTIYDHYRSLQLLYDLLEQKGMVLINPLSQIEVKAPPGNQRRTTIKELEIKQLYSSCENDKERAILSLNYGCGLRVGEIERLEIQDLKLDDGYLIVRKGKGNKRRAVPMSTGVIKDVRGYMKKDRVKLTLEKHYNPNQQIVMLNQIGKPMREWTLNYTLQNIARRTGNDDLIDKRITTHIMRHSIATHLLNRGLDLHQVRQFLGHVLLSTTQIYTHIENKQILQI